MCKTWFFCAHIRKAFQKETFFQWKEKNKEWKCIEKSLHIHSKTHLFSFEAFIVQYTCFASCARLFSTTSKNTMVHFWRKQSICMTRYEKKRFGMHNIHFVCTHVHSKHVKKHSFISMLYFEESLLFSMVSLKRKEAVVFWRKLFVPMVYLKKSGCIRRKPFVFNVVCVKKKCVIFIYVWNGFKTFLLVHCFLCNVYVLFS